MCVNMRVHSPPLKWREGAVCAFRHSAQPKLAALHLLPLSPPHHIRDPSGFLHLCMQAHAERLRAAASQAQTKQLGAALLAGVGFHNAAMEGGDRELVEGLFLAQDLMVRKGSEV